MHAFKGEVVIPIIIQTLTALGAKDINPTMLTIEVRAKEGTEVSEFLKNQQLLLLLPQTNSFSTGKYLFTQGWEIKIS